MASFGRELINLVQDAALKLQPLRHAFLNEFSILHGFLQRFGKSQIARFRQRRGGQHAIRPLGVCHDLADNSLRIRMRIKQFHIHAGQDEPRHPARADHPAADAGRCFYRHFIPVSSAVWRDSPRVPSRAGLPLPTCKLSAVMIALARWTQPQTRRNISAKRTAALAGEGTRGECVLLLG